LKEGPLRVEADFQTETRPSGPSWRDSIAEAVQHNVAALAAARQRYQEGVVDFLNVLGAQGALLQNQNTLAQNDTDIETDLVALYRVLGGGWEIADDR